jgi:hypothetical protein
VNEGRVRGNFRRAQDFTPCDELDEEESWAQLTPGGRRGSTAEARVSVRLRAWASALGRCAQRRRAREGTGRDALAATRDSCCARRSVRVHGGGRGLVGRGGAGGGPPGEIGDGLPPCFIFSFSVFFLFSFELNF